MLLVSDHEQLVVQSVFTRSSKTVGERSSLRRSKGQPIAGVHLDSSAGRTLEGFIEPKNMTDLAHEFLLVEAAAVTSIFNLESVAVIAAETGFDFVANTYVKRQLSASRRKGSSSLQPWL
jgi:hypothetical protein